MEPVTHLLTGACLARTGFHRRVAYATVAMVAAAEFPDVDTLWSLRGPVSGFEHHRGITHTLAGLPFEAGLLLLLFCLWSRFKKRRAEGQLRSAGSRPTTVRWGALYALILLALLSHLLLDYTNNYGLRPFLPFNDHWYAASIVFIFDPLMFLLLAAGLLLPSLFRLVGREIGERNQGMAGSGWARSALVCVLLLWGIRAYEHGRAVALAERSTLRAPAVATPGDSSTAAQQGPDIDTAGGVPFPAPVQGGPLLPPLQTLASPDPLSWFRWYTATDFGPAIQLNSADSRLGTLVADRLLLKPPITPALETAERSRLGGIYLNWSPMPFLTVDQDATNKADSGGQTVRFEDPRFMATTSILHREGPPPLTGTVVLGRDGKVLEEGMDGRFGR